MTHTLRLRKRRNKLWAEDPRCRKCGVKTIPPQEFKGKDKHWRTVHTPRMATLEHLRSKLNPERANNTDLEFTTLFCWKCNQESGRAEEVARPKRLDERSTWNFGVLHGFNPI